MAAQELTFDDLQTRYTNLTATAHCECALGTELVSGQPADEAGVRAFVIHHLGITDPKEVDDATSRILKEEVGEQNITPPEGEIPEKKIYGVRCLRRRNGHIYIGDWMIKACIKQAASRLSIFKDIKGSKGNFAEAGRVSASGVSLLEPDDPQFIFVKGPDGLSEPEAYYKEFMGRVHSPQGAVSIIHHSECLAPGSRFDFDFQFIPGKVKEDDVKDVLALAMIVGLGSARSLERGKFRITKAVIEFP